MMYVNPARLAQALTAILTVAVRFAEGGQVIVRPSMQAAESRLYLDVVVTGRGLAPADRDKVFDAFRHADRARRHGSLGLGPSLARAILRGAKGGSTPIRRRRGEPCSGCGSRSEWPTRRARRQRRRRRLAGPVHRRPSTRREGYGLPSGPDDGAPATRTHRVPCAARWRLSPEPAAMGRACPHTRLARGPSRPGRRHRIPRRPPLGKRVAQRALGPLGQAGHAREGAEQYVPVKR